MNLVLIARQEERLKATADRLEAKYGIKVISVAADLADFSTAKPKIDALQVPIGLLVYNAAFAPIGSFETRAEADLALAAAVNVQTPLLLVKALSGPMIQRKKGGIVLMSSLVGLQGSPNLTTYAATKSFNTTLGEGLWRELRPHGIDVLTCCAGAILTPGYQGAQSGKTAPGTLGPQVVAEKTLRALGRGPVYVPGATNKVFRFIISRVLSRRAAIRLMANNTGDLA